VEGDERRMVVRVDPDLTWVLALPPTKDRRLRDGGIGRGGPLKELGDE